MKQKAAEILGRLDRLISEDLDQQDIARVLKETFTSAFNSVKKIEQKNLYHALSLIIHPDKANSNMCLTILNEKGLNDITCSTLNTVWGDIQKNNNQFTYNPFKYAEAVKNKLSEAGTEIFETLITDINELKSKKNKIDANEELIEIKNQIKILESEEFKLKIVLAEIPIELQNAPDAIELNSNLTKIKADIEFLNAKYKTELKPLAEDLEESGRNMLKNLFTQYNTSLSEHFPDLYKYEQYPIIIQNMIYGVALIVNTALIAILFTQIVLNTIVAIIHALEVTLLSFATKNRFARDEATISMMKAELLSSQISIEELNDDLIKHLFDTNNLNTPESKRLWLRTTVQNLSELTEEEELFLFKKLFIKIYVVKFSSLYSHYLNNNDVATLCEQLDVKDIDTSKMQKIIDSLPNETIEAIYNALKIAQNEHFEAMKNVMKYSFRGTQHVSLIAKALDETALEEASVIERLMQSLIILATLPLTVAGFAWDMFSGFVDVACILIKAASVALINAPLDIQAYFTPEPALQLTNPTVNPEQFNSAAVGVHGLFALQHKHEERAIAQSSMANVL